MPNLPLQSLQNLINNKTNRLNLISEEFQKINVTDEQSKGFENIFLVTSLIFSIILGSLTYINFQKNKDLEFKYNSFKNNLAAMENYQFTSEELKTRIEGLNKYIQKSNEKRKISSFFEFITEISKFLKDEQIVQLNYNINNLTVSYQLYVNSSKSNLDQDLNSFLQKNLLNEKVKLESQTNIPNSKLIQYEFKGTYELR